MGGAAPLPPDSEQLISSTGLLGSKTVVLKKKDSQAPLKLGADGKMDRAASLCLSSPTAHGAELRT